MSQKEHRGLKHICISIFHLSLCPCLASSLFLNQFPDYSADVEAQWVLFWLVLWKWWRPDCSPPPSRSTSLKSSSAPSMEPVWPASLHQGPCTVSSKEGDFYYLFFMRFHPPKKHPINFDLIEENCGKSLDWFQNVLASINRLCVLLITKRHNQTETVHGALQWFCDTCLNLTYSLQHSLLRTNAFRV